MHRTHPRGSPLGLHVHEGVFCKVQSIRRSGGSQIRCRLSRLIILIQSRTVEWPLGTDRAMSNAANREHVFVLLLHASGDEVLSDLHGVGYGSTPSATRHVGLAHSRLGLQVPESVV